MSQNAMRRAAQDRRIQEQQLIHIAFASSAHTINGVAGSGSNVQLDVSERFVRATSAESDGTAIITLPSKAEAIGLMFYIHAPTGATGGDISVYDKEAGSEITTYGDLDADGDEVVFYCTGDQWVAIFDGVA